MLMGLALGFIIGLFFGRKNYESCREQIQKLEGKIHARKNIGTTAAPRVESEIAVSGVHAPSAAEDDAEESGIIRTAQMVSDETNATKTISATSIDKETAAGSTRGEGIEAFSYAETRRISHCPQKLARIKGIGRVYEDKLYQAGIGTFWQVATTGDIELGNILGIKDFQAVDLSAIKQAAMQLAEVTDTAGNVWSGENPDDLESLPGIGKTYETRLYDAGVCTWKKLASLTAKELASILKAPQWNQPDYEAWIAFAKERL